MTLFEPYNLNGKRTLKNRIVMPALVTRLATEAGEITEELTDRVHGESDARIAPQIIHFMKTGYSGHRAMPPLWMPEKVNVYLAADIRETLRHAGHTRDQRARACPLGCRRKSTCTWLRTLGKP